MESPTASGEQTVYKSLLAPLRGQEVKLTESSLRGAICNWLCCEAVSNILEWSRRRRRRQTMIILPSGLYEPRRSLLIGRGAAWKTHRVLGGNKLLSLLRLGQLSYYFTLGSALQDRSTRGPTHWGVICKCHHTSDGDTGRNSTTLS